MREDRESRNLPEAGEFHKQQVANLFDVCGHGLGAALLSVSILSVLRSSALPGVDFAEPAQVLAGLNRAFPMSRHENKFTTIWYGVYDLVTHDLTYGSAGHPAAQLISSDGSSLQLTTDGLPIGCFASAQYTQARVSFNERAVLYLFSDGLYEVRQEASHVVALEEIRAMLKRVTSKDTPLSALLSGVTEMFPGARFGDDVSFLRLSRGN